MNRFEIELPIIYKNYGKPPRHRNPDNYNVLSTAAVSIPVLDPSEMLPAVTAHFVYVDGDGVAHHSEADRTMANGNYYAAVTGVETLADADIRNLPKVLRVPSANTVYQYAGHYGGGYLHDKSTVFERHVVRDGFDAAVAELQTHIDDTLVIVDGVLHSRAKDPVWGVWINDEKVEVYVTFDHTHPHFTFPADCEEEALAFAEDASRIAGVPVRIREKGVFEIHSADLPHATNPVVLAANGLWGMARLNYGDGEEFGVETKELGKRFKETPTPDDAVKFMEAFEKGAVASRGSRRVDLKTFAVFRAFLEHVPPRFLGGDIAPISIARFNVPTLGR